MKAYLIIGKKRKEVVQQDNDRNAVLHDLICDGAAVLAALITMAIWMV